MGDLDDLEIRGPAGEEPEPPASPPPREPRGLFWVAGGIAAAMLLGVGAYLALRPGAAAPTPQPSGPPAPTTTVAAAPSEPPPSLPPVDESDGFIRELARGLSAHAGFGAWLAPTDLVRRFVGAVVSVARGESPRGPLDFLAPKGAFAVVQRRGRSVIDPRSYARYDGFAEIVASLDAPACARVYRQLEPLLLAGFAELGVSRDQISATLEQAFRLLLETPEPQGDVAVRRAAQPALVYEFVEARLETLTSAQKHLVRLGPANARKVKAKLRELKGALAAG